MIRINNVQLAITADGNKLLESESFYIPVPSSDVEQTESGESFD